MNWMTSKYHRATNPKRRKQRRLMHFARHTAQPTESHSSMPKGRETDAKPWYQTAMQADSESLDIIMLEYGRNSVRNSFGKHSFAETSDGPCAATYGAQQRCSFTPTHKALSHEKSKCNSISSNQNVPRILYYNNGEAVKKTSAVDYETTNSHIDGLEEIREATYVASNAEENRMIDANSSLEHSIEKNTYQDTSLQYRSNYATSQYLPESPPSIIASNRSIVSAVFECNQKESQNTERSQKGPIKWPKHTFSLSSEKDDLTKPSNELSRMHSATNFKSKKILEETSQELVSETSISQNSVLERPPPNWQSKLYILHSDIVRFGRHSGKSEQSSEWKMSTRTRRIFHQCASSVDLSSTGAHNDELAQVQSVAIYLSTIIQCYQIEATITTKRVSGFSIN